MRFRARVEHPRELGPVGGVVHHRFIGHYQQPGLEERQYRMRKAEVRRAIAPARDHLGMRLVADVHDERAVIQIPDVGTIGPLRIDADVVRAVAAVKLGVAWHRRFGVAYLRARILPAARFDRLRGIAYVNDAVNLMIFGITRLMIRRAAA